MARTGRRPGGVDTRGEILTAARTVFAARGFHAATIRAIAAEAEVDPSLVIHYFGSKEDLFGAALELPMRPTEAAEVILSDGLEGAGRNAARLFFTVWEIPESRTALLAMLRGAFSTDQGAAALREFITTALLDRVASRLDHPDAELRVSLMASHLIGVAVLRYVVGFEAIRTASVDELVEMIGPRIQGYLTG